MKLILFIIFIILFLLLVLGFSNMNSGQIVTMKFLGLRISGEFTGFIFSTLLLGAFFGWFVTFLSSIKFRVKAKQLEKKLFKAEQNAQQLNKAKELVVK